MIVFLTKFVTIAIDKEYKKRIPQFNNKLDNFGHNKPSEFYPNTLPPTLYIL